MKKVVLIGDSIRMGYDKYVKDALKGEAEVLYPGENCRFAQYVYRSVGDWKNDGNWGDDVDVVHWNAGLWDTLRIYGDEPITPPEMYAEMIKRIDSLLRRLFPNAKFIFATSTRVIEERFGPYRKRYNKDVEEYNRIALEVLKDTGTVVNDLYAVTKELPIECYSDMTHLYTTDGANALSNKVLEAICAELGIEKINYDVKNFSADKPIGQ